MMLQSETITLDIGAALTFAASQVGTARITRLANPRGGEPYSPVNYSGAQLVFGPYDTVALFRIEVLTGAVAYAIDASGYTEGVRSQSTQKRSFSWNAGERSTVSLPVGQTFVFHSGVGTGSVVRLAASAGGEPFAPVAYSGSGFSVGPFTRPYLFLVICDSGVMTADTLLRTLVPVATPAFSIKARTVGNWSVASNVTLSAGAYTSASPSGETSGLKIAKPTTGTFGGAKNSLDVPAGLRLDEYPFIRIRGRWNDPQGSVAIRFSSDNLVSKRREFSWSYSGQLFIGWNELLIRADDDGTTTPGGVAWSVVGGQALSEVINAMQISITTNSGTAAAFELDEIAFYKTRPTKGFVCLGFDAFGEDSIVSIALPIWQEFGVNGYWAGDANLIDGDTNANRLLKTFVAAGNDPINSGMYHPVGGYVAAGAAQLATDYDTSRAIFDARGFTRARNLFAYPYSANDASTDAVLLAKGVQLARSGWGWSIVPSPYRLGPKLIGHGAYNLGGKTLAAAKKYIDHLVLYGEGGFPFTHKLVTSAGSPPVDTDAWDKDDYREFVRYICAYRDIGLLDVDAPTLMLQKRYRAPTLA